MEEITKLMTHRHPKQIVSLSLSLNKKEKKKKKKKSPRFVPLFPKLFKTFGRKLPPSSFLASSLSLKQNEAPILFSFSISIPIEPNRSAYLILFA